MHFLCCGPPPPKKKFENHCCSEFKECVEFTTVTETHRIELGLQITPQDRIYGFVTSGQSFIWNPIPGHTDVSESLRMRSDQINHKNIPPYMNKTLTWSHCKYRKEEKDKNIFHWPGRVSVEMDPYLPLTSVLWRERNHNLRKHVHSSKSIAST